MVYLGNLKGQVLPFKGGLILEEQISSSSSLTYLAKDQKLTLIVNE